MSVNDQYALNWSNHTNHIRKAFDSLLAGSEFVDVTLSCEGKKISAHKMLLSACSTYFHDLFRDNPCQHPIVILKDVKFQNLIDILKFMYNGEVSVATENFDSFLKTAELLQVSGLTDDENRYSSGEKQDEGAESSPVSFTDKSERANVRSIVKKSTSETPKEKEVVKKRMIESSSVEESTSQKKRKENELQPNIEIKQEDEADVINLEEENLEIRDPLELDQQNESIEAMDLLQPAGSQKFADVQDLLNVSDDQYLNQKEMYQAIWGEHTIPKNVKLTTTVGVTVPLLQASIVSKQTFNPNPPALISRHFPTQIPRTEKKQYPTRNCRYCPGRKETRWECVPCGNIPLHNKTCFEDYHRKLLEGN